MKEVSRLFKSAFGSSCLAMTLLLACPSTLAAAIEAVEVEIDIPAQHLGDSLVALARQHQTQIIAPANVVGDRRAAALRGSYTLGRSLDALLQGTGLTASVAASGIVVVTVAADTPASNTPPNSGKSPRSPQSSNISSPIEIENIVVLGQKRARSIYDTSSSVALIDAALLEDLTFTELTDLYRFTPNVNQLDSSEGTFSIRGVPAIGGLGFAGVANTSSLYIDEIFQSNLGIEAGPSGVFDLDQAEIYRGPQSTIQGRNTLMGAVVLHTRNPEYVWSGKARLEVAEYNTQRYGLAFGGPIVDQQLAFRIAADFRTTDGYVSNPVTDRDNQDEDESLTLRTKVLFEPTDKLSTLLTYVYSEGDASTGLSSGVVQGPDYFAREVSVANPVLQSIDSHNLSAKATYTISPEMKFDWITTYSDAKEVSEPRFRIDPNDGGFLDLGSDNEEIITTDLRLLIDLANLDMLLGLYYFERDRASDRDLSGRLILAGGLIDTNFAQISQGGSDIENYALYIDGEFALQERLAVLFGLRYDRERYASQSQASTFLDPEFPTFGLVTSIGVEQDVDTTFDAFLPKLGLRYEIDPTQTIGLIIQRGYRSGGAGINPAGRPFEFDSEYLWSYEVFYRSTWWDGRMSVNANVFYLDWTDQQVGIGTGLDVATENAAESRLWGLEGEVTVQFTPNLKTFLTVGYNDTEFVDFDAVDEDLNGNEFGRSPDMQASLGVIYENSHGLFLSVDASWVAEAFSGADNSPSDSNPSDNTLDAYMLFNAKAGFRSERWAMYGFARNAFDEEYALLINQDDFRSGGLGSAVIGNPQVFGVELTLEL